MSSDTRKITPVSKRACPESEGREETPVTDARLAHLLERLEAARASLWEALRIPGVEGQAGIFARLEDMQEALEALRRDGALSSDGGAVGGERRAAVAAVVRDCQETLKRMERVFAFVSGLLDDRAGEAGGDAYSFARHGGGRRPKPIREGSGNWEG